MHNRRSINHKHRHQKISTQYKKVKLKDDFCLYVAKQNYFLGRFMLEKNDVDKYKCNQSSLIQGKLFPHSSLKNALY